MRAHEPTKGSPPVGNGNAKAVGDTRKNMLNRNEEREPWEGESWREKSMKERRGRERETHKVRRAREPTKYCRCSPPKVGGHPFQSPEQVPWECGLYTDIHLHIYACCCSYCKHINKIFLSQLLRCYCTMNALLSTYSSTFYLELWCIKIELILGHIFLKF